MLFWLLLLQGTFSQDCLQGVKRSQEFRANRVIFTETNYQDASCQKPLLESKSYGFFSLGSEISCGVRAMDFLFVKVTFSLLDPVVLDFYNQKKICGIFPWRVNHPEEITGKECDFFSLGSPLRIPQSGEGRFGIWKLEGDHLYLGELSPERDASTPERRPQRLSSRPYRRIKN